MHQQPGHCPAGRPRPAGTYGAVLLVIKKLMVNVEIHTAVLYMTSYYDYRMKIYGTATCINTAWN